MSSNHFSTEYFIPTKSIPYGIPLNCTNNNSTDGEIIVYASNVS